jgi:TfoX/Sxy family transcriptional regulator of competence genes
MAYNEQLAARVRQLLEDDPSVTEQPMFGGLAFLVNGHMAVAASRRGGLMVRIDPTDADALVGTTPARVMEMRGRPMDGWLYLEAADVERDDELAAWVQRGSACARSLPPSATARDRAGRLGWPDHR